MLAIKQEASSLNSGSHKQHELSIIAAHQLIKLVPIGYEIESHHRADYVHEFYLVVSATNSRH